MPRFPRHIPPPDALAYKWIRIIYKCWKEQIPYDDTGIT